MVRKANEAIIYRHFRCDRECCREVCIRCANPVRVRGFGFTRTPPYNTSKYVISEEVRGLERELELGIRPRQAKSERLVPSSSQEPTQDQATASLSGVGFVVEYIAVM